MVVDNGMANEPPGIPPITTAALATAPTEVLLVVLCRITPRRVRVSRTHPAGPVGEFYSRCGRRHLPLAIA
jgi:hypothetical protein